MLAITKRHDVNLIIDNNKYIIIIVLMCRRILVYIYEKM